MSRTVPPLRIRAANAAEVAGDGRYVLYWMVATRRLSSNFALDRAIAWARRLGRPLVILEPLRCGYRWASDRFHKFILDGMAEHKRRLAGSAVRYFPYVESAPGEGKGLLGALAAHACVVVTDDNPGFFYPRMLRAAAKTTPVLLEAVDSYGLLPLHAAERAYPTAFGFRRHLQRELPEHLPTRPRARPFAGARLPGPPALPSSVTKRWPEASARVLAGETLGSLPIAHDVAPTTMRGGTAAARKAWRRFHAEGLDRYLDLRSDPSADRTSMLSPYLHFGHISAHEVFWDLMDSRGWEIGDASPKAGGHRDGWWRLDPPVEAFLDQLVTWREVAANTAAHLPGFDRYAKLPEWARTTLGEHAGDPREPCYTRVTLEAAATHDELWNAAQRQLVREGRIHNALRMLWGKNILGWSASPRDALRTMVHLNNKYALDGRDPNSDAGIFWVLGRYDRPWGPERPVYGKVRYMSSTNTGRKLRATEYAERYGR
ncbi:MAG: cryptochrome/DNA photolyase family protein [Planctomycetota bacterium]|jgi:deoxyribodipyrimidine photo-lyase